MWTTEYIFSQICACLAVLSLVLSAVTKKRTLILIFAISNSVFFGLQYLLLQQYSGAVLNFIGIIRGLWYFLNEKFDVKKSYKILSLVVCEMLMIVAEIFTYTAWYSILPFIGTFSYTIGVWQKNVKTYRWTLVCLEVFTVAYNVMVRTIVGIVLDSLLFVVALVSAIKSHISEKKEDKTEAIIMKAIKNNLIS